MSVFYCLLFWGSTWGWQVHGCMIKGTTIIQSLEGKAGTKIKAESSEMNCQQSRHWKKKKGQLISKGWARKLACLGYHHFIGSIFSMVLMCSQIVYLMLCTCCPEMLWRTILGDGSQRKDCTRGSSITIYPRCHGQQVHNINSKHSIFLGCGFMSYCKWLIFSSCSCSWCLLLKSLCDLCGCLSLINVLSTM